MDTQFLFFLHVHCTLYIKLLFYIHFIFKMIWKSVSIKFSFTKKTISFQKRAGKLELLKKMAEFVVFSPRFSNHFYIRYIFFEFIEEKTDTQITSFLHTNGIIFFITFFVCGNRCCPILTGRPTQTHIHTHNGIYYVYKVALSGYFNKIHLGKSAF